MGNHFAFEDPAEERPELPAGCRRKFDSDPNFDYIETFYNSPAEYEGSRGDP